MPTIFLTSCPVETSMAVNTVPEALQKRKCVHTHFSQHMTLLALRSSKTNPCPIFSYRVYFFLGSPILTMVPEPQKKKRHIKSLVTNL